MTSYAFFMALVLFCGLIGCANSWMAFSESFDRGNGKAFRFSSFVVALACGTIGIFALTMFFMGTVDTVQWIMQGMPK